MKVVALRQEFAMGLPMTNMNIHEPTTNSSNTAASSSQVSTLQELVAQRDNVEAELSALGSVLDSVFLISKSPRMALT